MIYIFRLSYYFDYLKSDPIGFAVYLFYLAVTVLTALILHEVAHGYVALRCGDPTAKWMGRLSLDPRKHLDPIGTICMLLFGFGWAKPVPVNPRNFRDYRRDDFYVSIAGICMNLTLFIACTLLSVLVNELLWGREFIDEFVKVTGSAQGLVNVYARERLNYASLIYSGSAFQVLSGMAQMPWLLYVQRFLLMLGQINLSLAMFNLLPIPPLDGYHLVNDTIMKGKLQLTAQSFRIAQIVLLFLCYSGCLSEILGFLNENIYSAVANLFLVLLGH